MTRPPLKEIKEKKLKAAQEYLSKNIELKHCKKCAETGYLNSMFSSIFKKARGANTDNQYHEVYRCY